MEVDTPTAVAAPHTISSPAPSDVSRAKAALRARMRIARAAWDPALGEALPHHFAAFGLSPGATIAGFWPLPGEIDTRPLLASLHRAGHRLLLPETLAAGLLFRAWAPGQPLLNGRFGTMHPAGEAATPDVVLVPLLAFDRRGGRLGFGGGFYDRALAALPGVLAIGIGFAAQEWPVPTEPHDRPLHGVATEREACVIRLG